MEYSILLVAGALIGLIWANLDYRTYHQIVDFVLLKESVVGHLHAGHGESRRVLTVHYLINDILMAFFFAQAGKEVWEAVALKDGSLRGRKAATPLFATAGGMIGPIAVYLGIAALLGSETYSAVANGWAIPTATDIAFSYVVGRIIFGAGHPAVRFLLLLAIADDAAGLIILAVFYPSGELAPEWLLLSLAAVVIVYLLFNHIPHRLDRDNDDKPITTFIRHKLSFWPYAVAGALSWYGFQEAGIHPALGLLPVIPAIPHADRAFGLMVEHGRSHRDLLNSIEHRMKHPIEFILFLFGFANAGVEISSIGAPTVLVLLGLLVGKPIGIMLFGWLGAVPLGFGIPKGMRMIDIAIIGLVAAIGFTVSLFIASVAFESGPVQDAAKMGALLSLSAAVVAIGLSRFVSVSKIP
ncbi:MAG: Na+/H+ antiporter NhaA [Rhodobacteraceae bacterium]|nr:Na+/H+ antiporter NhaA [Paracoccaceae bacterium]